MKRRDLVFRVFVSSTFSDLKAERDALQQEAFSRLRAYCEQHNARFQAIDLRWGVSDEASLDQQTMDICFQELERCQELSPKPNFIILLGQRYGWRPLPRRIPSTEFLEILAGAGMQRNLLVWENPPEAPPEGSGWYVRDDNARPVLPDGTTDDAEYVLRPRRRGTGEEDPTQWRATENKLRDVLHRGIQAAGWSERDPRRNKYVHSATQQEIERGALKASETARHVYAYFRAIENPPADLSRNAYVDSGVDADALKALKHKLAAHDSECGETALPSANVFHYHARWTDDRPVTDLSALCERVYSDIKRVIDEELDAFQQQPGLDREIAAHRTFGADRCAHFKGREGLLLAIHAYLKDAENHNPLILHGQSGSGKTSLMAQAAKKLSGTPAVVRFIGATPGSADLRSLLRSLCEELGIQEIPQELDALIRAFRERLSGRSEDGGKEVSTNPEPAILFLDALDQLNATDNAHMLYWLPRKLAPGVKVVLSVLKPDEASADSGPSADAKDRPTRLLDAHIFDMAGKIWPGAMLPISPMNRAEGADLLDAWLAYAGRALTEGQRAHVLDRFEITGKPLYLKLAFEEAKHWTSWEGLPCGESGSPGLSETVEGALADMLHRLERQDSHGRLLVERALGNMAAAKNGLTEDELLDLLSRDIDVYAQFICTAHHMPADLIPCMTASLARESGREPTGINPQEIEALFVALRADKSRLRSFLDHRIQEADRNAERRIQNPGDTHPEAIVLPRLPVVQWSRLHAALKPYLSERRADGTNVISFYHRQVAEAVAARYLANPESRLAAHRRLAAYFRVLDYWAESIEDQRARAKRLPPTPRPVNIRKVVELPYQLLETAKLVDPESSRPEAREWNEVVALLTDWQFLEAKAEADPTGKYQGGPATGEGKALGMQPKEQ